MKPSRFIILLITAVMLLGTVGAVSAAPTLVVEVPTEEVDVGETITVPVIIRDSIPVVGIQVGVLNNVEGAVITINKNTLSPMFLYGGYINSIESNDVQSLAYSKETEIIESPLKLFDLDVKITGNNIKSVPVVVTVNQFYDNYGVNHASEISPSNVIIKVAKSPSIATTIEITSPVDDTELVYGTEGVATAVVYDQYGEEMDAQVTWTATNEISIDASGNYKVVSATPGSATITASAGDASDFVYVTLTKATLTANDFVVTGLGEHVWTGNAFEADVKAADGVTGIGDITVTYNGESTVPVNKGEYVVKISVTEGDNYLGVTDLELGTIKITGTVITPPTIANDLTYNGDKQTVALVDSANSAGMYEISGNTETDAGDYTVTLTLTDTDNTEWKDTNSPSITLDWKILPKSISNAEITASELTYNGEAQLPTFTVTLDGKTLTADDYTESAESEIAAGEYDVKVTGKGNYDGEASGKWNIVKAVPTAEMISCVIPTDLVYTGEEQTLSAVAAENIFGLGAITLKYNGADAAVDAGDYDVTANVAEGANYTAASELVIGKLTIGKANLDKEDFTLSATSAEFNNEPQIVTVTPIDGVTVTGVKYNGDSNAPTAKGTYTITITATGGKNYNDVTDLEVGTFVITGRQVAEPEITGTYTYTGAELTAVIADSEDYTVTGNKATAAGTHIVVVSLNDKDNTAWKNGGTDDLKLEWIIAPKSITGASATTSTETDAFTYDGEVKTPTFIVTDGTMTIAETDYIIEGDISSAAAGKHQVTIKGQNNYTGSINAEWNIAPAIPTIDDIVFTIPTGVVYGQTYEVTAEAKDTVFGLGAIKLLYNDDEAVPVNAGTYKVNASIAAGANYTEAVVALSDLVIAKATPVAANITCVIENVVYDGKEHPLTATAAEGVVGLGTIKLLYNDAEAVPVANATYVVKAQIAEGDNYVEATVELGSFIITKAELTADDFTFTPSLPVSYEAGSAEAVVVTVKEGIFGNGTITVKYGDSTDLPTTEGIYKVNATFAEGANYTASEFYLGDMTIVKNVAPVFGDIGTENADGSVTVSGTQIIDEAKNTTTVESNGVSLVIAFSDMTKVSDDKVKGNITGVTAIYPTNGAASPFGSVQYNLTINLGDKLTTLLPEITSVYDETIAGKISAILDSKTTFTGIAMMTAKGANVDLVNQNLTSVTIVFTIPKTVMDTAGGIDKFVVYHVGDAKPAKTNFVQNLVGDNYVITINGDGFSSYVAGTQVTTTPGNQGGSAVLIPSSSSNKAPSVPPTEEPKEEPTDKPDDIIPDIPGTEPTDPTEPESPAPVAGMVLGALAAAAVLRRK